jgi:hypothetical protein
MLRSATAGKDTPQSHQGIASSRQCEQRQQRAALREGGQLCEQGGGHAVQA